MTAIDSFGGAIRRPRVVAPGLFGAALPLALALTVVAISSCKSAQSDTKEADRAVAVTLARAQRRPMPVQIRTFGTVEAFQTVAIKAQVAGEVIAVDVKDGQLVNKDDPLFTLDSRLQKATVRAAEAQALAARARLAGARANLDRDMAQLRNAVLDYDRAVDLSQRGGATKREFDQAKNALDALTATTQAEEAAIQGEQAAIDGQEAAKDTADIQLKYTDIRSPLTGVAGEVLVDKGNMVKINDVAMVVINQVTPIYVNFSIPQQEREPLEKAMKKNRANPVHVLATTTQPDKVMVGDVISINNEVDSSTGMLRVKAQFPNTDWRLWPGQFVNVVLQLGEEDAVVVPSQAVVPGQQGAQVFVVKPDKGAAPAGGAKGPSAANEGDRPSPPKAPLAGVVELRPVKAGREVDGWTVVDAVAAGEWVVVDGQLSLTPGAKVIPKPPIGGSAATSQP